MVLYALEVIPRHAEVVPTALCRGPLDHEFPTESMTEM
jgi:hypothetical protein